MPRVDPSDPIHHPQAAQSNHFPEIVVDCSDDEDAEEAEDEDEAAGVQTALTERKSSKTTTAAAPEAIPGLSTDHSMSSSRPGISSDSTSRSGMSTAPTSVAGMSTDPTSSGVTESNFPKPPPRVPKAEEEDIPDID